MTLSFQLLDSANVGNIVISGSPNIGSVLTITAIQGASYQWLRNGVNIAGANSNTYTLVFADGGKTISCELVFQGKIVIQTITVSPFIGALGLAFSGAF